MFCRSRLRSSDLRTDTQLRFFVTLLCPQANVGTAFNNTLFPIRYSLVTLTFSRKQSAHRKPAVKETKNHSRRNFIGTFDWSSTNRRLDRGPNYVHWDPTFFMAAEMEITVCLDWYCADWKVSDVSDDTVACVFRAQICSLLPWKWSQQVPKKSARSYQPDYTMPIKKAEIYN